MKAAGFYREIGEQDMYFEALVEWIPTQLVKQSMTWDQRATVVVGAMEHNAFVLMVPKIDSKMKEDPLTQTFMATA